MVLDLGAAVEEIEWNGEFQQWEGWVRLPLFAPYDCSAVEERDEDEDEEAFELLVSRLGAGNDAPGPTQAQRNALIYLQEHAKQVHDAIVEAVLAHYAKYVDGWREYIDEDEVDRLLPDVGSLEGLRPIIGLHSVSVDDTSRKGLAPVTFTFRTAWEDEHRLVVVAHGTEIIGVGGDGTGYYDPDDWSE